MQIFFDADERQNGAAMRFALCVLAASAAAASHAATWVTLVEGVNGSKYMIDADSIRSATDGGLYGLGQVIGPNNINVSVEIWQVTAKDCSMGFGKVWTYDTAWRLTGSYSFADGASSVWSSVGSQMCEHLKVMPQTVPPPAKAESSCRVASCKALADAVVKSRLTEAQVIKKLGKPLKTLETGALRALIYKKETINIQKRDDHYWNRFWQGRINQRQLVNLPASPEHPPQYLDDRRFCRWNDNRCVGWIIACKL